MYKVIGGDNQEYGPVTGEELCQWIAEGRLSRQSLAQAEGSTEWRALASFPDFEDAFAAQPVHSDSTSAPPTFPSQHARFEPLNYEGSVNVADCLSRSGQLLGANLGLLIGASTLTWLLGLLCQLVPLVGGMLYMFLFGAFYGGLYLVFLKRIRGQPASVTDIFAVFSISFGQLALTGFLSSLLSSLGYLFCFIPGLYLFVAWTFAIPLAADRRLEAWSAMELSRKVVTRSWLQIAALLLLAFLPVAVMYLYAQIKIFSVAYPGFQQVMSSGSFDMQRVMALVTDIAKVSVPLVILNKVVLLFNLPFAVGALMYAYEDLFGARKDSQP
jgi:hypothetical protein